MKSLPYAIAMLVLYIIATEPVARQQVQLQPATKVEVLQLEPVVEEVKPDPVVKEEPLPNPFREEVAATIEYHYGDSCVWCVKWKAEVQPIVKKAGWKVVEVKETEKQVPFFIVKDRGIEFTHKGFMSVKAFNARVLQLRRK